MKSNVLQGKGKKLNDYKVERNNDEYFKQYAVLHKHEEGTVIILKFQKISRLMSLRSSK